MRRSTLVSPMTTVNLASVRSRIVTRVRTRFNESASVGDSVGVTGFATDADAGDSVTYSLTSNPNNAFAIDATTGEVTVADPSGLDFETCANHADRSDRDEYRWFQQ